MQYFSSQYISDSLWITVLSITRSLVLILFPELVFQSETLSSKTVFVFSEQETTDFLLPDASYLSPPYKWLG